MNPASRQPPLRFLRWLFFLAVLLLVPLVPFLVVGGRIDDWVAEQREFSWSPWAVAGAFVGLLAADILLPVPSSMVSTLAGHQFGTWGGTAISWLGMSVGAVGAFALARWLGPPLVERFVGEKDRGPMERWIARSGAAVIVLARAVPLLAEASVLLVGANRLDWTRFLPAVLLSNLGISLGYAAFGDYAHQRQWLPAAIGVAVAAPVLATLMMRRWLRCPASDETGMAGRLG